ncbi:MAG: ABC transporter permease [Armatimonadota bacterium]
MASYLARRVGQSVIVLVVVCTVTFLLVQITPGRLGILADPDLDPQVIRAVERAFGLDQPLPIQYVHWVRSAVAGDLGYSFTYMRPVRDLVLERLFPTMLLVGSGIVLAVALGVPLGVAAARRQYGLFDHSATVLSFLGLAIPNFWLGIMFILLFSVYLRWLPASGMVTPNAPITTGDLLMHLLMPAVVLGTALMAQVTRFTRSSMLEVLQADYVRTARSKGAAERGVLYHHALRNAAIPIVTIIGVLLPGLIGGAAITETIFSWPGMGRLAVNAAHQRDYPVVLGVTIAVAFAVLASNLLVDLLYAWLNPQIRYD